MGWFNIPEMIFSNNPSYRFFLPYSTTNTALHKWSPIIMFPLYSLINMCIMLLIMIYSTMKAVIPLPYDLCSQLMLMFSSSVQASVKNL